MNCTPIFGNVRFIGQFKECFRRDGDNGDARLQSTPSKDDLKAKLTSLMTRWKGAIPSLAYGEVEKLIIYHVENGCLTDIPPGMLKVKMYEGKNT